MTWKLDQSAELKRYIMVKRVKRSRLVTVKGTIQDTSKQKTLGRVNASKVVPETFNPGLK